MYHDNHCVRCVVFTVKVERERGSRKAKVDFCAKVGDKSRHLEHLLGTQVKNQAHGGRES